MNIGHNQLLINLVDVTYYDDNPEVMRAAKTDTTPREVIEAVKANIPVYAIYFTRYDDLPDVGQHMYLQSIFTRLSSLVCIPETDEYYFTGDAGDLYSEGIDKVFMFDAEK